VVADDIKLTGFVYLLNKNNEGCPKLRGGSFRRFLVVQHLKLVGVAKARGLEPEYPLACTYIPVLKMIKGLLVPRELAAHPLAPKPNHDTHKYCNCKT
jgi:hypothetical protein